MRQTVFQRLTWRLNNGRQVVVDQYKYVELLQTAVDTPLRVDAFVDYQDRKLKYRLNREEAQ